VRGAVSDAWRVGQTVLAVTRPSYRAPEKEVLALSGLGVYFDWRSLLSGPKNGEMGGFGPMKHLEMLFV